MHNQVWRCQKAQTIYMSIFDDANFFLFLYVTGQKLWIVRKHISHMYVIKLQTQTTSHKKTFYNRIKPPTLGNIMVMGGGREIEKERERGEAERCSKPFDAFDDMVRLS